MRRDFDISSKAIQFIHQNKLFDDFLRSIGLSSKDAVGWIVANFPQLIYLFKDGTKEELLEIAWRYPESTSDDPDLGKRIAMMCDREADLKKFVRYNAINISYVDNPSEGVQLAAVRAISRAFCYIKKPTEKIKIVAVASNPLFLCQITGPSFEVIRAAMTPFNLRTFEAMMPYLTKEAVLYAVTRSSSAIGALKKTKWSSDEDVRLAAVKKFAISLLDIKNPSEAVQIAAVEKSGTVIRYIENPSEAVQISAIQQARSAINFIRNPTDRARVLSKLLK